MILGLVLIIRILGNVIVGIYFSFRNRKDKQWAGIFNIIHTGIYGFVPLKIPSITGKIKQSVPFKAKFSSTLFNDKIQEVLLYCSLISTPDTGIVRPCFNRLKILCCLVQDS